MRSSARCSVATVSAVIIVRNEEKNIDDCLSSLKFCDEVIVVDSGSRDRTAEWAGRRGARIFQKNFTDFSSQKNYGIQKASCDWILLVDADERVSPELAEEIRRVIDRSQADGYYLLRHNQIFGRWMKYGANAKDKQLRLVQKGKGRFEGVVHERIRPPGRAGVLHHALLHYSTRTVSAYMKKLNLYSSLEVEVLKQRNTVFFEKKMKRRPILLFFYLAFWKKAVLDGPEGFFFAALSAYYEFVRLAKYWEIENPAGVRQKKQS